MAGRQPIGQAPASGSIGHRIMPFARETVHLIGALLNPRKVMREVEDMLLRQAEVIESSDRARARALRLQARQVRLR